MEPSSIPEQEKNGRMLAYLMMQLMQDGSTASIESQIYDMREYVLDYEMIPIHASDQAERIFLQEALKMLREFSIELWVSDEHRLQVLEEVRKMLNKYTGLPPYTPFTRDKFYV